MGVHISATMEGMLEDASIWKADLIRVPLQLLLAKNPEWSADYEAFVRTLAPDADCRVFDDVSHFLMLEKPEPVNRAMSEFLTRKRLLGFK